LVQEVYSYKATDIKGMSPVITIAGAGFRPHQLAADAYWTTYYMVIHTLVLYSDLRTEWTVEQAEAMNDEIVEAVTACLFENRANDFWTSITMDDRSSLAEIQVGGVTYLNEAIPVQLEMTP